MDLTRLLPLLFFNLLYLIRPNNGDLPYEPINNICERCICIGNDDNKANNHFVLDCTGKGLKHFLTGWPDAFGTNHTGSDIFVSFSDNDINVLQQLSETMGRVFFSCRNCKIQELKSAAFVDVPNILRLDLSFNEITSDELRPDVFRGRYNDDFYESISLIDLDLSYNYITILDELLFEHLPNLKRLSLAYNKIEFNSNSNNNNNDDKLDSTALSIGSNKNIEHLDLSYNNIVVIPDITFKNMNKLRELLLHGNKLIQIPESISLLGKSLKSLYIGDNNIEILNDESFTGLKQLTHLNISNNKNLYDINDNTFVHLTSLEVLICCNNLKLKKIDLNNLLKLKNMRELDLSNCSLKEMYLSDAINIDTNNNNNMNDNNNNKHNESNDNVNTNDDKQLIKLRSLKLKNNPWHCECMLTNVLEELKHYNTDEFQSDDEARCNTPYDLAGTLLTDLKRFNLCNTLDAKRPLRVPSYDPPPFLRPRSIVLTILTVLAVVIIGLIVGFIIVYIKKKLRKVDIGFSAPVRYTTVRNSTISVH